MGQSFYFDGRRGNLGEQMTEIGHPFYDGAVDGTIDYMRIDIREKGPMTITVLYHEQAGGKFYRSLRDHAEGRFLIDEDLTVNLFSKKND